jgi:hypothetical protein
MLIINLNFMKNSNTSDRGTATDLANPRKQIPLFLQRLFRAAGDNSVNEIIHWAPSDNGVVIQDRKIFK